MPYIIDGNNLLCSAADIAPEDPEARAKLLSLVEKFQQDKNTNITLVFDGVPHHGVRRQEISAKFTVLYPHYGNSADDEIREILDNIRYFKDVILVTSDRELKAFAREKGAKTINSIEFYFELKRFTHIRGKKEAKQKRIDTKISAREIDQWMKIFDET
ncbi:MAG: NYN domain-containing protein [Acidobacteria bacterium]|jgi:predicted RNA-binding protein with PIN domain|nr:NYN domain-containing protein [Acidobacteriota bacterium]